MGHSLNIVGFRCNGSRYYYEKNLQGDIIGIYDEDANKLCEYVYDAWGNCTIKNDVSDARIGEVNSFRYRGYYYDSDIGLYYLKSRYYDAITGRFINADSLNYLGANGDLCAFNLFAYCSCKPTRYVDPSGCWILGAAALVAVVLAGLGLSGCGQLYEGPTLVSLTDDEYETYDDALTAANKKVYETGTSYKGKFDENGNLYDYGAEASVDIYYDETNFVFRITKVYTDEKETEIRHRDLSDDGNFIMVANTHFHPDIGDGALVFSPEDVNLAFELGIIVNIYTADKKHIAFNDYLPGNKAEWIE